MITKKYPLSHNVFDMLDEFLLKDNFFDVVDKSQNILSKLNYGINIDTNTFYNVLETDSEFLIDVYIPTVCNLTKENVSATGDSKGISIEIPNSEYSSDIYKSNIPEKVKFKFSNRNLNYELDYSKTRAEINSRILKLIVPKISRSNKIEISGF